jgi:hypothetical protein
MDIFWNILIQILFENEYGHNQYFIHECGYQKCLHIHISLYFLEWRDGFVTIPAVISVKKVFAILKGRDHDSTGWRHLDKSWCKASE